MPMPELFTTISSICAAFGLSGAAGLNAYIPLLTIALMQNRGVLHLVKPYDVMGEWWVIALLAVLLVVEIIADKIPGVDHINDVISTAIRPTAGALIFAAQMGQVEWVHPAVWIVLGLLMSGGVHTGKAVSRPIINLGTAGIGGPIVSVLEDLVSVTLSIVAILLPILAVVLLVVFGWILFKLFRKFFGGWSKKSRVYRVRAVPVDVIATVVEARAAAPGLPTAGAAASPGGSARQSPVHWGGGV